MNFQKVLKNQMIQAGIRLFLLLFISLFSTNSSLQAATVIKNLRVEYLKNPVGIDVQNPQFSWVIVSDEVGKKQSVFEITVSNENGTVIWSSGKVHSDKSVGIKYDGAPLSPSTRYMWKVDVWDENNAPISSAENAYFETGLLSSGWSDAKWLKLKKNTNDNALVNFTLACEITVINQNAGVIFGAKDVNNMYMWAINTYNTGSDFPVLRRHIFTNGNITFTDVSLQDKFTKEQIIGVERRLRIEVIENVTKTYLDNTLIDTYPIPELKYGYIGFRVYSGANNTYEHAYIDNVEYKYLEKDQNGNLQQRIYTENFENGSNDFEGTNTIVVNGNTKMDLKAPGNADFRVLQGVATSIPMFRTEFTITKEIKSARIYSSGLGVYDMFINGKRIGTPQSDGTYVYDEFKPGWTDYRKTVFYSTYDITKLLKDGQNALGAHVSSGWLTGAIAHNEYGNPDPGFLAKIVVIYSDNSQEIIVTNPTNWKASANSAIRMADIYHGETYDARKESDWSMPGFDVSDWNGTEINDYFNGDILSFIGEPVRVRPELEQIPKTITIYYGTKASGTSYGEINVVNSIAGAGSFTLKKGETAIFDFGQNIVGWTKFKVKGAGGTKMRGRFAEMLNDSGDAARGNDNAKGTLYLRNLRAARATMNYILKGDTEGETFNPSMTFFGFRYCEITATENIEILSMTGEVVGNTNEEKSSFSTNNELVNKLYSNVVWGQRGNFLSVPTDCPQRDERLGWMGDTQIFSRAATYNADVASFFHKWVKDVRDSQQADGTYPSVVPDNWKVGYGRTAWAEAGIIVPWNIYLMYGDREILRNHYASMERFMAWMALQQFDGFLYNGGNTQYGDWLAYENTNPRFISVSYYAFVARLMEKISNALSQTSGDVYEKNAGKYNTLYNNIKAEFQKRYISTRTGLLLDNTQTAYLLALSNDLFPTPEATQKAINYLVDKISQNGNKLSTGFVGTGILNQTLSQYGASETAYNLLLQRSDPSWLYSVDQGATTIWERWNSYTIARGFGDPGMNSFNHYSYGAVSEWMYRYMAGIEADESTPGFKHFILQPTPDLRNVLPESQITKVDATYGSYYGPIKSKWEKKSNGNYTYTVTVPANTSATMYILKTKDTMLINQQGVLAENVPGVISVTDERNRFALQLESGTYVFDTDIYNTSVGNPDLKNDLFRIYPNPVQSGNTFFVETNLDDFTTKNVSLTVFSLPGNKITDYKIDQKVTSILLSQHTGAYVLEFKYGERLKEKTKLIVN